MECKITMDRSTTECWSVDLVTGEAADLISESDDSSFESYWCETHEQDFDSWSEVEHHMEAVRVAA